MAANVKNKRSIMENVEKQIVRIIENNSPELAAEEILRLLGVSGQSEQLKALFDKHYEETGYISMTLEDSERYLKSL